MIDDDKIKEIVYDDNKIVETISKCPQSYNSILGHLKDNGTLQVILRRRIRRLLKQEQVWKMRVPGTRFGLVLFCTPEHDYKILTLQGLTRVRIFYMYKFIDNNDNIMLNNYWELKGQNWNKWEHSTSEVIIPKNVLRGELFRLWE
jgi:hypothetical protein